MAALSDWADDRFRSGVGYWSIEVDNLSNECKLANGVDCGVWRLPAVDATVGTANYTEWAAGPKHFDDVKVKFLMNEGSKGLYQLAHDIGLGINKSGNRFHVTLAFKNSKGDRIMAIDYKDASIVGHKHLGYTSTAHGEAAEEELTFRANNAEVLK